MSYSAAVLCMVLFAALVMVAEGSKDAFLYIGGFGFLFFALTLIHTLAEFAEITSMCMSTRAVADFIPAAARRAPRKAVLSEPEKQAHQWFLTSINGNQMGVEFCDVILISSEFVFNTAVKFLVQVPAFYGILTAVLGH